MPWNDTRMFRRKVALGDVEIGAADAARGHANQDFSRPGHRLFDIGERQRIALDRCRRIYDHCTHNCAL
jgi:hypothetical protein